jgi:hypothetical protein
MANTSINLVDLDFASLKNSFKIYLQEQPLFKDYDFEGSNINVLLDLLSYNTFKNAFYLNMVLSEAFLDSAQLRNSVLSHAKELNYLPNSVRSSKATIDVTFEVEDENLGPYTIQKGSPFTALVKNEAYTFTIPQTITVSSSNTTFSFQTDIYEGIYVKDTYTFLEGVENQRFKITNRNVDTNSITVVVYEDNTEIGEVYTKTTTLLGLNETSQVFFIQPVGNGYFEILFGDNLFGRQPKINSTIVIDYRISAGSIANGAKSFSLDFDPTEVGAMSTYTVTTVSNAAGGADEQSIESIRRLAPRYFASQQRAVAADDYTSLVLSEFSQVIDDVSVFGGETVEPKQYGRVLVALKPLGEDIAPDSVKTQVQNYLEKYASIPTRIQITDPVIFYCDVNTTVQFDRTSTSKTISELQSTIKRAIDDFSNENLEMFNSDFRYSKFVTAIDDSDISITSNDTTVRLIKRLSPRVNFQETYQINFNNPLHPGRLFPTTELSVGSTVIQSTPFTFQDELGNNYTQSYLIDNGSGTLIVYTYINDIFTVLNSNVGTVNYSTGQVNINKIRVSDYTNHISVYATLRSKDIIIKLADLLIIDLQDVTVNVIEQLE